MLWGDYWKAFKESRFAFCNDWGASAECWEVCMQQEYAIRVSLYGAIREKVGESKGFLSLIGFVPIKCTCSLQIPLFVTHGRLVEFVLDHCFTHSL